MAHLRCTAGEILLLDLPLREPFAASHGVTRTRTVAVVRLETDRGEGWGECAALPAATYTPESAAGAFTALADDLVPAIIGRDLRPDEVAAELIDRHPRDRTGPAPMAVAAVEMALFDAWLRSEGRSLAQWLGVEQATVPAGVALGLDEIDRLVLRAERLVADGYRRLKVKIQPGHDQQVVRALRAGPAPVGRVELHLDANGAYGPDAVGALVELAVEGPVEALEQPLAPAHIEASVDLVDRLATATRTTTTGPGADHRPPDRFVVPVVGDESVPGVEAAADLFDRGAISGVSIKPARVGGLVAARALHELCLERGMVATAGGMLETGLGRHALAAVAALPGFTLTGDLSPAARWLAADPWPDLSMVDGRIEVPGMPGVAPPPQRRELDRHVVDRRRCGPARSTTDLGGRS